MRDLEISHLVVYGLEESLNASGYPMRTGDPWKDDENGERALKRGMALANTPIGAGHDNFLQGIIVQFDLRAPIKIWTELQRYHFIDFVSSQSTMHKIKDMNLHMAFDSHTDGAIIARLKTLQDKYKETKNEEDLLKLLLSCPVGLFLTARMTTNYRQLKTIIKQRTGHRLPHWREFINAMRTGLPMQQLIFEE